MREIGVRARDKGRERMCTREREWEKRRESERRGGERRLRERRGRKRQKG